MPPKPLRKPPVRVLLVLNADGFVEVYGPPEVTVHVALRLATDGGHEAEQTADELLYATLPRNYRDLYFPRHLRAMGNCERRTAGDEIDRRCALATLADLRDFQESLK